ncbi:hypothetical protein [Corticibacter populi]|uniref:hypothetical protein n=1 Tax=Corticibacter populi TaxID=1550736 RepID=UPI00102C358A|nr:hypothetical protein [Corticibacter populi]
MSIAALCADLQQHGVVYWHTVRPNFRRVLDLVQGQGLEVIPLCARLDGDFLEFMIRLDFADDELVSLEKRVGEAIKRWQGLGEPVPHSELV